MIFINTKCVECSQSQEWNLGKLSSLEVLGFYTESLLHVYAQ